MIIEFLAEHSDEEVHKELDHHDCLFSIPAVGDRVVFGDEDYRVTDRSFTYFPEEDVPVKISLRCRPDNSVAVVSRMSKEERAKIFDLQNMCAADLKLLTQQAEELLSSRIRERAD